MKLAILQLDCVLADVKSNMEKVINYINQASKCGANLILLPEFFPSAIGFAPQMNSVALEGKMIRKTLLRLSKEKNVIIGGSYLYFNGTECHNTFDLVFPDGSVYTHRKDIPTQFENCYYTNGDEQNILHTPIGDIGVALCWEMLRYDTLKRLSGKVDIVLAGSCWWDLPVDAPLERDELRRYNHKLALETPVTFAKLLHIPVVHANHCGKVTSYNYPKNNRLQTRQLIGSAQVIDSEGKVIERREYQEGEGLIITEIAQGIKPRPMADIDREKYWIPDMPEPYIAAWRDINPIGKAYYREHMRPYYIQHNNSTAE